MAEDVGNLGHWLEDKERFGRLCAFFIDKSIHEEGEELTPQLRVIMKKAFEAMSLTNIRDIFEFAQSPIERIFLSSLFLCFIRNLHPLLLFPPASNTPIQVREFRGQLANLDKFTSWYRAKFGNDSGIDGFWMRKLKRARCLTKRERVLPV